MQRQRRDSFLENSFSNRLLKNKGSFKKKSSPCRLFFRQESKIKNEILEDLLNKLNIKSSDFCLISPLSRSYLTNYG